MSTVSTALRREAESIFTDLGYAVSGDDGELRAERKWRVVRVTPMAEPEQPPGGGPLRCFVTWADAADDLERRLARADPEYEWAIIGVREDDYVVSRRPS
jgi:hypothetical protein